MFPNGGIEGSYSYERIKLSCKTRRVSGFNS